MRYGWGICYEFEVWSTFVIAVLDALFCYFGQYYDYIWLYHIDGLMQERCNSSALAVELRLSYTNPSISEQKFDN